MLLRLLRQSAILLILWAVCSAAVFLWHPDARSLLGGGAAAVPAAEGEVSLAEALMMDAERGVLWIDVRPAAEFEREAIPGAENIPENAPVALENKLFEWTASERLQPDTRIVIYCASAGCRSGHELRNALLRMKDDLQVFVLAGGWPEWKRGQSAIEPGPARDEAAPATP